MNRYLKIFTVIACMAALTAPSAAFAATSSQTGYGDDSANILPAVQDNGDSGNSGDVVATTTGSDDGDSLPFTGAELGLLAGAGVMLVLLGFGLRRLSHRPTGA
jgi:hypothetical protein